MAKRRKLETPSLADMMRIEEEFRRETPARSAGAPIAQVAADAADAYQTGSADDRANRARTEQEAEAYRIATQTGHLIVEIPMDQIEPLSLQRDRTVLDKDALEELEYSIGQYGVRLPVEVYEQENPGSGKRYGLLSGYRRFIAQHNIFGRTGNPEFAVIKAVVRDPAQIGGAFVAMVEENEIRQDLSHYERGRIAVIAAQQGAFRNTEEAVAEMFAAASKAKRSKIRSFAMIFEELGDMLNFPENLREKDGLRLAQGLRNGAENRLRKVLGEGQGTDAKTEWALIDTVLSAQNDAPRDARRGGRPSVQTQQPEALAKNALRTNTGIILQREEGPEGHVIRFSGKGVDAELIDKVMVFIQQRLEQE